MNEFKYEKKNFLLFFYESNKIFFNTLPNDKQTYKRKYWHKTKTINEILKPNNNSLM